MFSKRSSFEPQHTAHAGEELSHKVGVMFYALKQLFGAGDAFRFLSACNEARPESGEFDSYMLSMMMMQVRSNKKNGCPLVCKSG